jgi:transmembrane sensor
MPHDLKNIVLTFFEGQATPLQKKLIEEWLSNPENQAQYCGWLREWELSHKQYLPNIDSAWEDLRQRMENTSDNAEKEPATELITRKKTDTSFPKTKYIIWKWIGIAATLALLLVSTFLFFGDTVFYESYQTQFGEVKTFSLPDGSKVTLNANSSLEWSKFSFGKGQREVFLKGEALFSITHTLDKQRFIVKLPQQIEVEVLGTEFAVYAREKKSKVALHAGQVKLNMLQENKPNSLLMKKGDVVTIDTQGRVELKEKQETQTHFSWKEHRFVFNDTPLEDVSALLKENFDTEVRIVNKKLAKRSISGTFTAKNAEEMLSVLSEMLEVKIEQQQIGREKKIFILSTP